VCPSPIAQPKISKLAYSPGEKGPTTLYWFVEMCMLIRSIFRNEKMRSTGDERLELSFSKGVTNFFIIFTKDPKRGLRRLGKNKPALLR
jgi:hypothetical protein